MSARRIQQHRRAVQANMGVTQRVFAPPQPEKIHEDALVAGGVFQRGWP